MSDEFGFPEKQPAPVNDEEIVVPEPEEALSPEGAELTAESVMVLLEWHKQEALAKELDLRHRIEELERRGSPDPLTDGGTVEPGGFSGTITRVTSMTFDGTTFTYESYNDTYENGRLISSTANATTTVFTVDEECPEP